MAEGISLACLNMFCKCVLELYVDEYLRKPTGSDIARLYSAHEEKHDDIYPDWATLIKAYSSPTYEPGTKFKQFQESAHKDVERTFGVLQVEDNGYNITWLEEELHRSDEANPNYLRNPSTSREIKELEIRDMDLHNQLRQDLTEHIWELPPNFRRLND
ncbi:uncharacterized protein [Rutidosis leptorrhynchoides]|uniref:uncharacterized protein n=1 Tax=Rutidosis leptorrhynchoides TaxID=125765 RepID=UPI003A994000